MLNRWAVHKWNLRRPQKGLHGQFCWATYHERWDSGRNKRNEIRQRKVCGPWSSGKNPCSIQTRRRSQECHIEHILMYGCEVWIIKKQLLMNLEVSEMWFLRIILPISLTAKKATQKIKWRSVATPSLMKRRRRKQATIFGHTRGEVCSTLSQLVNLKECETGEGYSQSCCLTKYKESNMCNISNGKPWDLERCDSQYHDTSIWWYFAESVVSNARHMQLQSWQKERWVYQREIKVSRKMASETGKGKNGKLFAVIIQWWWGCLEYSPGKCVGHIVVFKVSLHQYQVLGCVVGG